ncbi:hypothetical protein ES332_1Z022100v1 [Gossypium tomentosum]|uniref:Patatin n=1 Tax=Gossypium tomentosum TaxID=34277 RepID=A0A5C7J2J0_GOSTO|nr:hypothetical protein ES332_1Z022100v1 [Gossypium tomentosum]
MSSTSSSEMQEPSIDTDKLSYEIFSILKSGNPNARIADFFDVAAGSGVGGIFTAMLFATKDNSRPILPPRRRAEFDVEGYTETVLIPCYDLSSTAPFLFSRADALETDSFDFPLWEVCRATSAEPGLFEPVKMRSVDGQTSCVAVDGGLAMSNPTAAAITHVLHNKQEFPFVRGVEDILVFYEYEKVKNWKVKDWAKPMARISGDGSADSVDQAVAMAFGHCRSSNYVRIQANGTSLGQCGPNVDTDPSPSNKNVESVLFGGKRLADQTNFEKLDGFAAQLVLEHQRRSCRIAPTVAFKQPNNPKPTTP